MCTHKTCNKCGLRKPANEFSKNKRLSCGLEQHCKECKRQMSKDHYHRKHVRLRRYGITHEQYKRLEQEQQGRCAICRTGNEPLVIDHDHETGTVRGLLCQRCNLLVGHANDDVEVLENAKRYIQRGHLYRLRH